MVPAEVAQVYNFHGANQGGLPDAADVLTVLDVGANMRLRACVMDVKEYAVTWESGSNPWEAT